MSARRGVPTVVLSLLLLLALTAGAPSASAVSLNKVTGGKSALYVPFTTFQKITGAGLGVSPDLSPHS